MNGFPHSPLSLPPTGGLSRKFLPRRDLSFAHYSSVHFNLFAPPIASGHVKHLSCAATFLMGGVTTGYSPLSATPVDGQNVPVVDGVKRTTEMRP